MSGYTATTRLAVDAGNSAHVENAPKGPTLLAMGGSPWKKNAWPTNFPSQTNRIRPEGADAGSHGCKPMDCVDTNGNRPGGADVSFIPNHVGPSGAMDHCVHRIPSARGYQRRALRAERPRELDEIDTELKGVTDRIVAMIGEISQ